MLNYDIIMRKLLWMKRIVCYRMLCEGLVYVGFWLRVVLRIFKFGLVDLIDNFYL